MALNHATVYITGRCNLACSYCFSRFEDWPKEDATPETLRATVDWLISESGDQQQLHLGFFGGEPLLRPDLIELCCEYAAARGKETGKKISCGVTTNLTPLTDEVLQMLKKHNVSLLASIDGLPHKGNQRFWADRPGVSSATDALSKLLAAQRHGLSCQIRWTVAPDALNHLGEDCVTLATLGFRGLAVEFVYEAEWTSEHLAQLEQELRYIGDYLIAEYRDGRKLHVKPLHDAFGLYKLEQRQKLRCGLGYFGVGVATDGTIQPCHRFVCRADAKDWAMGSVQEGLNIEKRDALVAKWDIDKVTVDDGRLCKDCPVKLRCPGGICPPSHLDVTGKFDCVQHTYCDIQLVGQQVANDVLGVLYGERNPLIMQDLGQGSGCQGCDQPQAKSQSPTPTK